MSRTETHLVNQNDQKLKGVIFAVVGAIFWGASGIFTQMLFTNAGVRPLWLVGIRLFFCRIIAGYLEFAQRLTATGHYLEKSA